MFVWAMRDKGSEWKTIDNFLASGTVPFTPLVEAVCEPILYSGRNPVTMVSQLARKMGPLAAAGRVWIDLGHLLRVLPPNDVAELHQVIRGELGFFARVVTPVVHTSSPSPVIDAAVAWAHDLGSGVCIRIDGVTRINEKAETVRDIVNAAELAAPEIDLILDAQDLPRAVQYDVLPDAFPVSRGARNWVILAGSFPASITEMKPDDYEHIRERGEWINWRDEASQSMSGRFPIYGDYATQAPVYTPSPPFPGSPSVRYTTADNYIVLRGRRGTVTDFGQYIGHALYLREQPYFREVAGTPGDLYVERIALRTQGTGNATTWRIASLERHLHVVATQIAQFARVFAR
jgi:hypothetical protein